MSGRWGVTLVSLRAALAALVVAASPAAAQVSPRALSLPAPIAQVTLPPMFQPYRIDRSNRVSVEVSLNGAGPYYFFIDTGSERTVISTDLARRLTLEQGSDLALATIAGRHVAPSFLVDRLATETIALDGLEAPALERRHLGAQGLIGLDGLDGHRVVLDFARDRMTVERTGRKWRTGVALDGTIVVNARRLRGRMVIHQALIDGIPTDLVIDTGTQTSIGNPALRDRMLGRRGARVATGLLRSVTGETIAATYALARQMTIAEATVRDLPISFADSYAFKVLELQDRPALLLGMDAIALFDSVTIDFDKRQVQFGLPAAARTAARRTTAVRVR